MEDQSSLSQVKAIHAEMGIPEDYAESRSLIFFDEESNLEELSNDIDERSLFLHPDAASAWKTMQADADNQEIKLLAFSGFRTFDYQRKLIERRLEQGTSLLEVLTYLAAPGYSEHHTGRAIDLTTFGSRPGSEEFEDTTAFQWLSENADQYGFQMSFPRDNPWKFIYEPWHWCYQDK